MDRIHTEADAYFETRQHPMDSEIRLLRRPSGPKCTDEEERGYLVSCPFLGNQRYSKEQ